MYVPCHVCAEPTSEHSNAVCHWCGNTYHLALRQDIPAKDCGAVWISEELMALEFACDLCITARQNQEQALSELMAGAAIPSTVPRPAPAPAATSEPKRRYARSAGMRPPKLLQAKRRRA
ncbi:MAG: hypothetical protein U0531_02555 [Dehalococcoidia bacterium]